VELPDTKAKKPYEDALKTIRSDADSILNLSSMGHQHRSKYLSAIRSDMGKDTRLAKVAAAFGGEDRFANLVGNIANLQLRALRWYFNDVTFAAGDKFEGGRLKNVIVRAFKYFHPDPENSKPHHALIQKLEASDDIVETLCTLDPNETIPPYEDQNNRRPPVDQTLLLNPKSLQKRFGDAWHIWAQKLETTYPALAENLDKITAETDRKSRICVNKKDVLPSKFYRGAYLLQRVLDRNKKFDPFALRLLASGEENQRSKVARQKLTEVLGSQHTVNFILFAQAYYDEVELAKNGLWIGDEDSLLECSGIHPPAKKKILPTLVGGVLQVSKEKAEDFIQNIWKLRYAGSASVLSKCRGIEQLRKAYGGEFNLRYKRALYLNEKGRVLSKEDKELVGVKKSVDAVAKFLKGRLGLTEAEADRFANPYSLSQLYTLIETERDGFTNTCLAVHAENAWRMTTTLFDGDLIAQCSRLPADCVRPFDGVVRRTLDRQAWELTKVLGARIKSSVKFTGGVVQVPFLAEANKFSFTASLYELKKQTAKLKKCEDAAKRKRKQWQEKDERIMRASKGLCPYTGIRLDKDGEIDHIIPRSLTNDTEATVFDSEANLIYVSPRGNQLKGDKHYSLSNLNAAYLSKIFGTSDTKAVEEKIEKEVKKLSDENRLKFFELLTEEQQAYVRHALFLDAGSEAREIVIDSLRNKRRTLVNGTQAWFLRRVIAKLQESLEPWKKKTGNRLAFRAWPSDAGLVHNLREALGKLDPILVKPDVQPVVSHTIDAMCSFAGACAVRSARTFMNGNIDFANPEKAELLAALHPRNCRVIRIDSLPIDKKTSVESRALFKDGIFAEEFLPIVLENKVLYAGFDSACNGSKTNRVEVKTKNVLGFLQLLAPFFDRDIDETLQARATYRINKQKAFAFLNRIQHSQPADSEMLQADVLESLLYHTVRKNLASALVSQNGKNLLAEDEVINLKKFTIKVELKTKEWKAAGVVLLPALDDWKALLKTPELQSRLGGEIGEFDLTAFLAGIRGTDRKSRMQHKKCRRTFSLPMVEDPSGGVRIQRTNIRGDRVYQTHSANALFVGFSADGKKVAWNKPKLLPTFTTKNLTVSGEKYRAPEDGFVPLSQWRRVSDKFGAQIDMAPGSADRRYVRVRLSWSDFAGWIDAEKLELRDAMDLRDNVKVASFTDKVPAELRELLGKPRSVLFIEEVGPTVQFRYIVESSNAAMKQAFDEGE
jgi:CRISPR system subtype II-B RNA-guided endonuclease Cas9/Csx12